MENTIIYIIGHYGVGKLTVADQVCAQTGARLLDNHLVNNVIFSLLRTDGATAMPDRVWDYTWAIRSQAVAAIAELAAANESYVLTNALSDADEMDRAAYEQIVELAAARNAIFVPVMLTCSEDENMRRVADPAREARLKHTDVASARTRRRQVPLIRVAHPNRFDLDNSELSPAEAAAQIVAFVEGLKNDH